MDHPFVFRPGTWDYPIFHDVVYKNEYKLPESFQPSDIIIDIGAHIGSFTYAALLRGASRVYSFEANKENFAAAVQNLQSFGDRVQIEKKAIWRSDREGETVFMSPNRDNNAAGHVLASEGEEEWAIDTLSLNTLIRQVTRNGRKRIRLLKIDCEGAEFPILLTASSRWLGLIDEIVGEWHEHGSGPGPHNIPERARVDGYSRYSILELALLLHRSGFQLNQIDRHPDPRLPMGTFFASRVPRTDRIIRLRSRLARLKRAVLPARAAG